MDSQDKIVILHCQDDRGRDMQKYKVFESEVSFHFEKSAIARSISIIENDQELYREDIVACRVPEEGGVLVVKMSDGILK